MTVPSSWTLDHRWADHIERFRPWAAVVRGGGCVAPRSLRSGAPLGLRQGVPREDSESLLMLIGGVRGGKPRGRVVPYYQVLAGGFAARVRSDYEWPASIDTETANAECGGYVDGVLVHPCLYVPYPEFDEEGSAGFVVQPGMGVDVWWRFTLRLAAALPILASGDYLVLRPKLSARVVVALGP